jgi:hypothetical protein
MVRSTQCSSDLQDDSLLDEQIRSYDKNMFVSSYQTPQTASSISNEDVEIVVLLKFELNYLNLNKSS